MPADANDSSLSVSYLQRRIRELNVENARLGAEQLEASQHQSATSEVLEVINSSSHDVTRTFQTILEKAHSICGVAYGTLQLFDGEKFRAVALHNVPDDVADKLRQGYKPGPYMPLRQLLEGAQFVHVRDLTEIDHPIARAAAKIGIGTTVYVALRKDDKLLGQITAARDEVRDFSDNEIALLQSFAQHAVVAMENARLLGELPRHD
jgi:two-component system NtrC family sensor kinase